MPYFLILLLAVIFGGCGTTISHPKNTNSQKFLNLDIMLSKGAYTGSHFESIQIKDGFAFIECGAVRSGKKLPSNSSITKINPEQNEILLTALTELHKQKAERGVSWPAPDKGEGFFDAGSLLLTWRYDPTDELKITTDLSAVKEPSRIADKLLREVVALAQALSTTPCKESSLFR